MKRLLLFLLPVLLVSTLFSCKRNDLVDHTTVIPNHYSTLEEALNSVAPAAKTTSFFAANGAIINATNGTTFYFPPNVFETLTGGKVTGSVDVTIQDWLQKGDMIYGRVLPMYRDTVLESGGEAYVKVTQNGNVLRIKKGMHFVVKFPQFGLTGPTYAPFVGRTMAGSSNTVNWLTTSDTLMIATPVGDTVELQSDTLHYLQPGSKYSATSFSNFTLSVTSPVVLEQSMAAALYVGKKAIYPLQSVVNGKVEALHVPAGPVSVIVMGVNAGRFYSGYTVVPNPGTDSTYNVTVKETAPASFKQILDNLL